MDDQLHAARLVEEALEHERVLGRKTAERRVRRGQVVDQLSGGSSSSPASSISQRSVLPPAGSAARRAAISARRRDTDNDSSSLRPGASPSQNGMVGGMPRASSTRTVPRSTRMIR